MNYYLLAEKDHPKPSWAISVVFRETSKHVRSSELPPLIYRYFGAQSEGAVRIKQDYLHLLCKACGRYDEDAAYDIGFSDPVAIRMKGDFGTTEDRILAISHRMFDLLREHRVRGFEAKPLGSSGWYALRVTTRVECDPGVMQPIGPFCPICGRPDRVPGEFTKMGELSLPGRTNTLFTTTLSWAKPFWGREVFLTEDVVQVLKASGIRGGSCNRLWTDEEAQKLKDYSKAGKSWRPPHSYVML